MTSTVAPPSRRDPSTPSDRRRSRPDAFLALVLAGALLLRLAWCLHAARRPEVFGDPFAYLVHGEEIARGHGYRTFLVGAPTAYYPVGYPAILGAAIWAVHLVAPATSTFGIAIALNLVAGLATAWFVHDLARRLAGARVARVAAALVAVFPGLVLYTATVHLETVFTFLVVVFAWLLVARPWDGRRPAVAQLLALGAVLAVATYVRPIVLGFVPLLVVLWRRGGLRWGAALSATALVLAVVVAAVLPWSVRSTRAMGDLVVLSTNTGDNLCVGHSAGSEGRYHHLGDLCWPGFEDVPADRLEVTRDQENTRRALRYAIDNPVREVELLGRKAFYLFQHDHEALAAVESYGEDVFLADGTRTLLRWAADLVFYAVVVLAAVGAVRVVRAPDLRWRVVLAWTATLLLVPLVFFGGARFHVPALPFLAVLAALALPGADRGPARQPATEA